MRVRDTSECPQSLIAAGLPLVGPARPHQKVLIINQNLNAMKKFTTATFALLFGWCGLHAQTGNFGGVNLLGSSLTVDGEVFVGNACVPPPDDFKTGSCSFTDQPMVAGFPVASLPNTAASLYCMLIRNSPDDCCKTSVGLRIGMEIGGDNDVMELQWLYNANNGSACEEGCPYVSNAEGEGNLSVTLSVPGAPGSTIPVWYDFSGYISALSVPEADDDSDDYASITVLSTSIGNNDLHDAGNMTKFIESSPGGFGGDWRQLALSGYLWVPANTAFEVSVTALVEAYIHDPGRSRFLQGCGMQWRDRGDATYYGNLRLSVNNPVPPPPVPSGTSPAASYFSLDIGSAGELSDPFADGSEFFDPGDAYRVRGPVLPSGGADGFLDDGVFMGADISPSAPDAAVPSLSAAPIGSGLPPNSVISQYLNIDGLARTDFEFTAPTVDETPIPYNQFLSQCVFMAKHLYLSFDDDAPSHYTDVVPSVPANSTPDVTGRIYGSAAEKDEITEAYTLHPFFGGSQVAVGIAQESNVHSNLAPNPSPFGPDEDNDDVNALSLAYSSDCDKWYISVDHEATGVLPDGTQPDPGTIYRVSPTAVGLTPVATPSQLGIPAGTDVNAFEFIAIFQPFSLPQGPALAVLFSVDTDDPLTPNTDESGGLDPGTLYASFMQGSYFVWDSTGYGGNIDAISNLPHSISNPAITNTCTSYNFTSQPTGLNVTITNNTLLAEWDPYPFATRCQVAANKDSAPSDKTFLVDNVSPPASNSFSVTSSQIEPGETYRVRVRCGCNSSNVSPFTDYVLVTAPVNLESNGMPYLFADEEEAELALYPNPADAFVTLRGTKAVSGNVHVRIFNALGQMVHSEIFEGTALTSGHRITVNGLTRGMYTVQTEMPGKIETLPLMITR